MNKLKTITNSITCPFCGNIAELAMVIEKDRTKSI